MHISVLVQSLLIVCSVLRFRKGFLKSLLGGLVLMDSLTCLKHFTLKCEPDCGIFLFGNFNKVYQILGLILLFGFGFNFLYSESFFKGLVRILWGKCWGLTNGVCSKNVNGGKSGVSKPLIDEMEERTEIYEPNPYTDSDEKTNSNSDEEYDTENNEDDDDDDEKEYTEEDGESDVSRLRDLLKIERHRANEASAELLKERAASATAAEEAMAMILRIQNEKALIEMESSQYRRLAEEKQIHDQEVIRSLQWLVWRHESERSLLEDKLKLGRRKLKRFSKDESEDEEEEEAQSSFNGNILDALENVLYSSRDANLSP